MQQAKLVRIARGDNVESETMLGGSAFLILTTTTWRSPDSTKEKSGDDSDL